MMGVKYTIQAAIVDINADKPKNDDIFLVDSNVWYWMTYTHASEGRSPPCPYQIASYPNYVKMALEMDALIYSSNLSLAELTHLIEKTQREIYNRVNRTQVMPKVYRHNLPEERSIVVSEVEIAWGQVKSLTKPLVDSIDENTANQGLLRFQHEKVDGYDLFILESMKKSSITQIITDDGDFSNVPNITVFTANQGVLSAAKEQDKLLERTEREPSLTRP
jgi:predicted nucleic acid-binding protein